MFIDIAVNPTTRAPEERNVSGDKYSRSATFRSSGAAKIFCSLPSINIPSLRDEELAREISSRKQELEDLLHREFFIFRQTPEARCQ